MSVCRSCLRCRITDLHGPIIYTDVDMSEIPLISIVDDDSLAREGICELVDSLGYKGVTFESANHFLQCGQILDTACLITDLQMPGLNGLELQEVLRSRGYQTPVIVITGYPNEKHRTRAFANGAVGFLSKPFNEQCLIECLNAAIVLRSSHARRVAAHHPEITTVKAVSRR